MDILLDVNIVLDICTQRKPHAEKSALALELAKFSGGKLWLYCGSAQTLEYNLYRELKRDNVLLETPLSNRAILQKTRILLDSFARDKNWLASLAGEGPVFISPDPEDEQLLRSLDRFAPGTIKLLTRDRLLFENHPDKAITPDAFIQETLDTPLQRNIDFIDLKTQQQAIRPTLEKNIHTVLHHGRYIMGPEIEKLETRLAEYVGVKHCITVSSGTDSLLIALMALGIGPGDEVITTPFTFIANGEMIALLGARPVFVDIDPRTCNIDPSKIESAITEKTRAVIPVSLYGQCADFDQISAIVKNHNQKPETRNQKPITVVEDAAQSFGATYKTRKSCALSTIGSTSFFPSKPLGGYGDGGALFTDDDDLAKAMREIRVHGQDRRYHHPRVGVNGRMDALQAAVVLAKMDRFEEEVQARQKVAARYRELLTRQCPSLVTPFVEDHNTSVYAQYTVQTENRDKVIEQIKQAGVPIAVHYPVPLHLQPAFKQYGYKEGDLPVAEAMAKRVFSLPMGPDLTEEVQGRIVETLSSTLSDLKRNT
jgi:UDP-2-acetamido-2-deoxy-ribo-hexuluronate aminotransferase